MAAATLTVPVAEWNRMQRMLNDIHGMLSGKKAQRNWVTLGEVMRQTGMSKDQVTARRNEDNSEKTETGRYRYDLNSFTK